MNKIETINLLRLRNYEHIQFMTDFNNLIIRFGAAELGITTLFPTFNKTLSDENRAIQAELKNSNSTAIEEQDKLRDRTWNAIYTRVKSSQLSPIVEEAKSGEAVMNIISLYGDFQNLSPNEENDAITKLVNDLMQPLNAKHLEKNGIKSWVGLLKTQNEQLNAILSESNAENVNNQLRNLKLHRKLTDKLYLEIIERINASLVLGAYNPKTVIFVNELNERISKYKTSLLVRGSRYKSKETIANSQN